MSNLLHPHSDGPDGPAPPLREAIRLARRRLLPLLVLMYVIGYMDRANVGFAKAALQAEVGLSQAAFALGAGLFFIGYALFEVPSNVILYRVGARAWLSRIMVTWGLVSACTAFVQGPASFYLLRFLLGMAEAGFYPGVILFLTQWFPARIRAQTIGVFTFGFPVAMLLAGPLSGYLLEHATFPGMRPWQWMFVIEGLVALPVALVAFLWLTDRPQQATWLSEPQRQALATALAQEDQSKLHHGPASVLDAVRNPRVLLACLIYLTMQVCIYGVVFYLPARIAALTGGQIGTSVGLITAVPWLVAIAGTWLVTRTADRVGHHRWWTAGMLSIASLGILASAWFSTLAPALLAFCVAAIGLVSLSPLFWTLPTAWLGGAAAAGGIAFINAMGNLGGFIAPNLKTWAETLSGRPEMGMLALSLAGALGVVLLLNWRTPAPQSGEGRP